MHPLFTSGYAGLTPAAFVERLRANDISLVLDIRRNPLSRKQGFSRTSLSGYLAGEGIGYQHLRDLGVPQELRNQLRGGECDLASYLEEFGRYLDEHGEAMEWLETLVAQERCCLLCVEADPAECHRSVVAGRMQARNADLRVVNL